MGKQKVYIETSVISYLTAKPSRDLIIAGHQQITVQWWNNSRLNFNCYVSEFVEREIKRGNKLAAEKRLKSISRLDYLKYNDDVDNLAKKYIDLFQLPEKASFDAYHLALAVWYNIDYLLSWNCRHIANAQINKRMLEFNTKINLNTPFLCSPQELLEVKYVER